MGISSSLNAGVSGLNANANKLATISDNIANSQTYGYKRADVDFSSMTVSDSRSPNTVGGGRWFTAGGVRTNAIWDIEAKGALTTTSNATDIALTGRGFLPVTSIASVDGTTNANLPFMLTTTGSFLPDANGYLRTPSGLVLMGWPADTNGNVAPQPRDSASGLEPVQINRSSVAVQPTSTIDLNANLPATETQAGVERRDAAGHRRVFRQPRRVADAVVRASPRPCRPPATRRPTPGRWRSSTRRRACRRGSYEIVFGDVPPNAGAPLSVTQTVAGTAPLSTAYDAATGDITLDLGNQTITIGVGSTAGGAAAPEPALLDLLADRRDQGRQRGRHLHRRVDRRERLSLRQLLERLLQGDLPGAGGRRAEPERAARARQPVLRAVAGRGLDVPLGRGHRADRRRSRASRASSRPPTSRTSSPS